LNRMRYGCLRRRGDVVITVDGNPTHYIVKKNKTPVRWTITMIGARSGVLKFTGQWNTIERKLVGREFLPISDEDDSPLFRI
jgi:hypothetical protein